MIGAVIRQRKTEVENASIIGTEQVTVQIVIYLIHLTTIEIGVMKNLKEKRIDHQGIEVVARGTQSTISIGGAADLLIIILGKNVENPEERNTNIKNRGSWGLYCQSAAIRGFPIPH